VNYFECPGRRLPALVLARGVAAALAMAGTVALASASLADAAYIHNPLFQLVSEIPVEGPHGEHVAFPGRLRNMESMTVDSGHVWVAEDNFPGPSRVDVFNATNGAFMAQPVYTPGPSNKEEEKKPTGYGYGYGEGIAVGHGPGEAAVYVGGQLHGVSVVSVYNEAGVLKGTWNGQATPSGSFGVVPEPEGRVAGAVTDVAADDSNSPLDPGKGNVVVASGSHKTVDVFRPEVDGEERYVGELTGTSPSEPFSFPFKVAVDETTGDLLVLDISNRRVCPDCARWVRIRAQTQRATTRRTVR
jgi:hypothetical protein